LAFHRSIIALAALTGIDRRLGTFAVNRPPCLWQLALCCATRTHRGKPNSCEEAGVHCVGWRGRLLPVAAVAQQAKIHRIGALFLGIAYADSFRQELREELRKSGYVEGQNFVLEVRSAEGRLELLPKLAAELVALNVDVIVAVYTPCAFAAREATRTIPIVAVAGDLLETGLVSSLGRPSGNITGISLLAAESHGKCVVLFREMSPAVRRIALLGNAADPFSKPILKQVQLAGRTTSTDIAPVVMVRGPQDIDAALAAMKREGAAGVVVQGSLASRTVAELTLKHSLPAATFSRSFAEVGGLISYGADGPESFRRSAAFVAKVLQGGNPATLPIEQPTKFELVINLKTAKALGITIPPTLLARADEVIE
jgi:putative ABC transport system substrate-binding protein